MKSITTKFIMPVVVLAAGFMVLDVYQDYQSTKKDTAELLDRQAALALAFDLAIRGYVAEEIRPAMEQQVAPGEFFPETMSTSFIARSIFEKVRRDFPDYTIKFSSDDPRNPANQAGPDELRMIQYFNDHPETKKWSGEIDLDGRPHMAHFNARRMKESCLRCHGNPEDAPASLVECYGPTAGFHRPVGEVVALDTVAIPLDKVQAAVMQGSLRHALSMAAGCALLILLVALSFRFIVALRLARMRTHFERIASQPDAAAMHSVEMRGNDEISVLSTSFNTMVDRVRDAHASLEQRVADQTADLRKANDEMRREVTERKRAEDAAAARTVELEKSRQVAMGMMEDAEQARKTAEVAREELHDNEERLQIILDTIQAGVVVIDEEDHRIVDVNSAALTMIGASREEVVGRVCHEYICPAEVGCCPISDLGQEVDNTERVLVKVNGETIPVLKTVTSVLLNDRRHLLESFVDISELKRAEMALVRSEQKFMDIFYSSADATLLIDGATFVDCNEHTVKMLRASNKKEVLATHPSELSPEIQPDGRSSFEKANEMIAVAFERGSNRFEWDHRRLDGEIFPVEVTLMPVPLFGKQVLYCMWKDITKIKETQAELRSMQQQLIKTSRQAGMAEVATDVLHNVGNVLNSVNVSAGLVNEKIRGSRVPGLAKATALMSEHADDLGTFITQDERGKQLPGYLTKLAEHLAEEHADVLGELRHLTENIEHIKNIVSMQQSLSGVSGVTETVRISDLLDDLLKMDASSLAHRGIKVICEYNEFPVLTIDKHKLTQILVNLLKNAKEALIEDQGPDPRLSVRLRALDQDRVQIEVADNAIGIPPENLLKIFAYGFTTKEYGHGFGLHSSALAAAEMGGSLTAYSDGSGRGATFTLDLPRQVTEKRDVCSAK